VVDSVTSFGMFVRPAGYDVTGLVHFSRIPRDLISALKVRAPIAAGANMTDVEALFTAGDVLKIRVHQVKEEERRLELSMLPYKAGDGDEDDYVVEGRDPEPEEGKRQYQEEE
jgi:ribosomal protein S1